MNLDRTLCGHCGFVVAVGTECPLCQHDFDDGDVPAEAPDAT